MRTKTLKQIGYEVSGQLTMNMWGGGKGTIEMQPRQFQELTTENVLRSVNDSGFGCESYDSAVVDVYVLYERGLTDYLTSVEFDKHDLWGCTNTNCDFKKLAEEFEKDNYRITDIGE